MKVSVLLLGVFIAMTIAACFDPVAARRGGGGRVCRRRNGGNGSPGLSSSALSGLLISLKEFNATHYGQFDDNDKVITETFMDFVNKLHEEENEDEEDD